MFSTDDLARETTFIFNEKNSTCKYKYIKYVVISVSDLCLAEVIVEWTKDFDSKTLFWQVMYTKKNLVILKCNKACLLRKEGCLGVALSKFSIELQY